MQKKMLPSDERLESNIFSFSSSVVLDTRSLFESKDRKIFMNLHMKLTLQRMGDSGYRLNFDQGKKNEIQHHS